MTMFPGINRLLISLETITAIAENIALNETSPDISTIGSTVKITFKVDTSGGSFKEAVKACLPHGCYLLSSSSSLYGNTHELEFTSDYELFVRRTGAGDILDAASLNNSSVAALD